MQATTYLSTSVENGRINRVQATFDQREVAPHFSITPEFQEYSVLAHHCTLQVARPWSKEANQIFKGSDIRCIVADDGREGHYTVIAMPGLSEKRLSDLLLQFVT